MFIPGGCFCCDPPPDPCTMSGCTWSSTEMSDTDLTAESAYYNPVSGIYPDGTYEITNSQLVGTGNDPPCRKITIETVAAPNKPDTVYAICWKDNATHNPSTQCPLTNVSFCVESKRHDDSDSGLTDSVVFVVRQNNRIFATAAQSVGVNWKRASGTYTQSNFTEIDGSGNPNFTVSGTSIEFGFALKLQVSKNEEPLDVVMFDNLCITRTPCLKKDVIMIGTWDSCVNYSCLFETCVGTSSCDETVWATGNYGTTNEPSLSRVQQYTKDVNNLNTFISENSGLFRFAFGNVIGGGKCWSSSGSMNPSGEDPPNDSFGPFEYSVGTTSGSGSSLRRLNSSDLQSMFQTLYEKFDFSGNNGVLTLILAIDNSGSITETVWANNTRTSFISWVVSNYPNVSVNQIQFTFTAPYYERYVKYSMDRINAAASIP